MGAWELGSGGGGSLLANFYGLSLMFIGLFLCPKRTLSAFNRGRHSLNLCQLKIPSDELEKLTVGELRNRLLDKKL